MRTGTIGLAGGSRRQAFTSEDWVREVIGNCNADGFESLYPKYKGKEGVSFQALRYRPR